MPKLIQSLHRNPILCASKNITTRFDTIPRHIYNRFHFHTQGERTNTTASWHSYNITATPGAQLRLHLYHTVIGTRSSNIRERRPSSDYIKHQQQRCFTHGTRTARGLGANKHRDGWEIVQGLWDQEIDDDQDKFQETVSVPQREVVQVNNGEVELDIYNPPSQRQDHHKHPSQSGTHANNPFPIILYLGAWPTSRPNAERTNTKDSARAQQLADSANATVVQVHYRDRTYPQPVHDVLAAWDWVGAQIERNGLGHGGGSGGGRGRDGTMGMGVYGHEVGGSLALMLGMTECDPGVVPGVSEIAHHSVHQNLVAAGSLGSRATGKPHIRAVAVDNPIVDWVFPQAEPSREPEPGTEPDTPAPGSPPPPSASSPSAAPDLSSGLADLIALRAQAFRVDTHPSSYFDPFASPIHFLRTPSAAIPPAIAPDASAPTPTPQTSRTGGKAVDEFDVLARLEEETMSSLRPSLVSETAGTETQTPTPIEMPIETRQSPGVTEETLYIDTTIRRKVPLRWPPSSMPPTARMPWFKIIVGEEDVGLGDTEPTSSRELTDSPEDLQTLGQELETRMKNRRKSTTPPPPIPTTPKANTQASPLVIQVTEMARLLRRAYVKHCLPREIGREEEHDVEAADIRSLVRAGDKIVEERVLKDIMAPDKDSTALYKSNDKGSTTLYTSNGRRKRRTRQTEEEGEEEQEEEKTLRARIAAVRRLAQERVGFEVLPPYQERDRLDGEEWYVQVGEHAWMEAEDTEEAIEEMEMEEVEEVGRWMGRVLRR